LADDVARRALLSRYPFFGSNDGRVCGLDLASGKKVWEYEAASPVTSSPAVAKGKVVVATADGQVICFR
jgi:outer membrane protein assembly factor BamB